MVQGDLSGYGSGSSSSGKATPKPGVSNKTGTLSNYGTGPKAPVVKKPTKTKPTTKPVAKEKSTETLSAPEAILNAILAPVYFVEDINYRLIKDIQDAQAGKKPVSDSIIFRSGSIGKSWDAATAPFRGEAVKHSGGSIAKQLGMIVSQPKHSGVTSGDIQNALAGFLVDVALDPLTYAPGGKAVEIGLKAVSKSGVAAIKGLAKGASGVIPEARAAKLYGADISKEFEKQGIKATGKNIIKPKNLRPVGEVSKAATAQQKAQAKLNKFGITPMVKVENAAARSAGLKVSDSIASSIELGKNTLIASLISSRANNALAKAAQAASDAAAIEAKAAAKEAKKGYEYVTEEAPKVPTPAETVVEQVTKTTKAKNIPFPETAPNPVDTILSSIGAKDAKAIESDLKYIDNIAKRVTGTTAASKTLSEVTSQFIKGIDATGYQVFKTLDATAQKAIKDAIKMSDNTPTELFNHYLPVALKDPKSPIGQFINSYGNKAVQFSSGRELVGAYLKKNAHIPFRKLPTPDRKVLVEALGSFVKDTTPELVAKLGELVKDKSIAQELINAGALAGSKADKPKVKEILDRLATIGGGEKVKYANADALIAGIRAGDIVATDSLMKIIKRIDPAHSVVAKVEQSATKATYEMFAQVLKHGAVPESISAMRQRMMYANTEAFMKATGLSSAEAASAYLDGRLLGQIEIEPSVFARTRENASNAVSRMAGKDLSTATAMIREAFGQRFESAMEKIQQEGGHARVSDLGDLAILGHTQPYHGEGAILIDQTNQSWQSIIAAKLAGIGTHRVGEMAKAAPELIISAEAGGLEKANQFVRHFRQVADVLTSTTGARMFIQKSRADVGADLANKHAVFLHMGDIVQSFLGDEQGQKIIVDAYFPSGINAKKYDALDAVSILKTTRQVIEAREKNLVFDEKIISELVNTAKYKDNPNLLSKAYAKGLEETATKFVMYLIDHAAPALEDLHLTVLKAATEDFRSRSLDLSGEIIDMLKSAWAASYHTGWATSEEKFAHIKDLFNRFAYSADLLRQSDGAVAEAVMRAASMIMVKNGKLAPEEGDALSEIYRLFPEKGTQDYSEFMQIIDTYSRLDDPMLGAPIGREMLPKPKPEVVAKVEAEMLSIKDAINKHMKKAAAISTEQALNSWRKESAALKKQLDSVRKRAWSAWLPDERWSNISKKWIPAEQFDTVAEKAWAESHPPILAGTKTVNVVKEMVDETPVKLSGAGNGGAKAGNKAKKNANARKRSVDLAEATGIDAAENVVKRADEIDALPIEDGEKAIVMNDEAQFQQIDNMLPKSWNYFPTYGNRSKNLPAGVERRSNLQRFSERFSARGSRSDVIGFAQVAEAGLQAFRSDLAQTMRHIHDTYRGVVDDATFAKFLGNAVRGASVDPGLDEIQMKLQVQLNSVVSAIIRDAEVNNIPTDLLDAAMKQAGLTDRNGFVVNNGIQEMMDKLPFIDAPKSILEGDELFAWNDRAAAFKNAELSPYMAIVRIGSAIHSVKTQQALAATLVNNVGHLAYGLSTEEALAQGWVKMHAIGDSFLMAAMPDWKEGALFHPDIAKQIASLDREWSQLMKNGITNRVAKTVMNAVGYIKVLQTTVNARHHVRNLLGDMGAELLTGNVNPVDWMIAYKLTHEHAAQMLKTGFGKDKIDYGIIRILSQMGDPAETTKELLAVTGAAGKTIKVTIAGKQIEMPISQVVQDFGSANFLTNSYYNDEVLGLYENLVADTTANGAIRDLNKRIALKAHLAIQDKLLRPLGDATAIYSNFSRMAGAVRIMRSKNWASKEQMLAAIADHTHMYHPSIQTLSAAERKYGRMAVGYYTWLRGATNATMDLLINHTASITLVPKVMQNFRQQQGINAISAGTPWEEGQQGVLPQNMRGSVYGALFMENGQTYGIKPPILPLDVLNELKFFSDPITAENPNQWIGQNWEAVSKWALGISNPVTRQVGQEIIGTDWQTGTPLYDRTPQAAWDRFMGTLGPSQLARSLGWTPRGKTEYTPEEEARASENWWTGEQKFALYTPGIQKAAQREYSARLKMLIENINKGTNK